MYLSTASIFTALALLVFASARPVDTPVALYLFSAEGLESTEGVANPYQDEIDAADSASVLG